MSGAGLLLTLGFAAPLQCAAAVAAAPPGLPLRLADAAAQYQAARELHRAASAARGAARLLELEAALRAYRAVERYWPQAGDAVAEAAFRRGEIERALDRPGRARAAFECAVDAPADPDWGARARLELAALHGARGEAAEALDRLQQVLAMPGVSPHWRNRARRERGELLLARGHPRAAAAAARAWAVEASSSVEEVQAEDLRLRALLADGGAEEAARALTALDRRMAPLAAAAHREAVALRRALDGMEARAALRPRPMPAPPR